jgi:hypothetical protein
MDKDRPRMVTQNPKWSKDRISSSQSHYEQADSSPADAQYRKAIYSSIYEALTSAQSRISSTQLVDELKQTARQSPKKRERINQF